jgi:hypothetical protein
MPTTFTANHALCSSFQDLTSCYIVPLCLLFIVRCFTASSSAIDRLYSWITYGGQDLLTCHYANILDGLSPGQLLLDSSGRAGTGKTPLIMSFSTALRQMAEDASIANFPLAVSAATVMTFNRYT